MLCVFRRNNLCDSLSLSPFPILSLLALSLSLSQSGYQANVFRMAEYLKRVIMMINMDAQINGRHFYLTCFKTMRRLYNALKYCTQLPQAPSLSLSLSLSLTHPLTLSPVW